MRYNLLYTGLLGILLFTSPQDVQAQPTSQATKTRKKIVKRIIRVPKGFFQYSRWSTWFDLSLSVGTRYEFSSGQWAFLPRMRVGASFIHNSLRSQWVLSVGAIAALEHTLAWEVGGYVEGLSTSMGLHASLEGGYRGPNQGFLRLALGWSIFSLEGNLFFQPEKTVASIGFSLRIPISLLLWHFLAPKPFH
ncbi:MAG: hypothetical protein H6727_17970 [Myxococcales bacterium]|nr:hypothetical protein [Myxococcales bacterium]